MTLRLFAIVLVSITAALLLLLLAMYHEQIDAPLAGVGLAAILTVLLMLVLVSPYVLP